MEGNKGKISGLRTDLYNLTTGQVYFANNNAEKNATFYAAIRKNYNGYGYNVFAGAEEIIKAIREFQKNGFSNEEIEYLRNGKNEFGEKLFSFHDDYLSFLKNLKFNLKIESLEDGDFFQNHEPILKVSGSIIECIIVEPILLNILNSHCAYATHAAHLNYAMNYDFTSKSIKSTASIQNLRRGRGVSDMDIEKTLFNCGYDSVSDVSVAKFLNITNKGTMNHAFVMSYDNEIDAFEAYAKIYPNNSVLLIDTYNAELGLQNAIKIIKKLREKDSNLRYGVRIDSGDIAAFSLKALRAFAADGWVNNLSYNQNLTNQELLNHVKIHGCNIFCVASDGIDEKKIWEMRKNGCYIASFGIGSACSTDLKNMGVIYKLTELDGIPKMKFSGERNEKFTLPQSPLSGYSFDENNKINGVILYSKTLDEQNRMVKMNELFDNNGAFSKYDPEKLQQRKLVQLFDCMGKKVYDFYDKKNNIEIKNAIREKIKNNLGLLDDDVKNLDINQKIPVYLDSNYAKVVLNLKEKMS